ncbi:MAG: branched-chain amino acid ABC transporter permease [Alphaproteobacteria bacterium]|nr:MAG: branched-chain amino acid ABC transporter permease [Alphaproteobacteria bacterium]
MLELLVSQALNGIQLGVLLFLMAAGLTLVLGIMNVVNLAHGSLYMVGAYLAAQMTAVTGSFLLALPMAVLATLVLGLVLEVATLRTLYQRDHLDQVLLTFGLILFFNEVVRVIWGPTALFVPVPEALDQELEFLDGEIIYPAYRLAIIAVGLAVAAFLFWLIARTRVGMLIRAGAANRDMVAALGVDIVRLNTLVFGLGAGLAGLAGVMAAPILAVESGMGDGILILTFVVIVIGGIGSIRGALVAAVLIGVVDTMGRSLLPMILRELVDRQLASAIGPAVASMLIYILMAVVLTLRPQGLFPARTG